jgi:hypothetical protein
VRRTDDDDESLAFLQNSGADGTRIQGEYTDRDFTLESVSDDVSRVLPETPRHAKPRSVGPWLGPLGELVSALVAYPEVGRSLAEFAKPS